MQVYVWTLFQFTDNTQGLPMRIESLNQEQPFRRISNQKVGRFDVQTVGLDDSVPIEKRGLSCLAAGLEKIPVVAVARLKSANDITNGEITDLVPVVLLNPGAHIGAFGYADFKVDLPLGSEAYYVCSASVGSDEVTTIIIKVVILPG
jgi:hypothetical protein